MNKHAVFVAGKRFILLSDDKTEYVENLAKEVGDTIARISLENPTLDRRSAAILCALDYADDKNKEILRNQSLSDKAKPLIAQADRQSKQLRELKEKLIAKENENARLQKELKSLREAFEKSTQLLDGKVSVKPSFPLEKKPEKKDKKKDKGYTPNRQYSLFDNE